MAADPLTPLARAALNRAIGLRRLRAEASRERRRTVSVTPKLPVRAERELERLLVGVSSDVAAEVREAVRGYDPGTLPLEQVFQDLRVRVAERVRAFEASPILDEFGRRLNQINLEDTARVLRVSTEALPTSMQSVLAGFRRANVELIGSVAEQQIDQVFEVVSEAVRAGSRVEDLAEQIEERFGVATSRARLIARDQVLKANSALTQTRMTAVGVTQYKWSTSRDERVRPMHRELEGTIQSWSDPPVTDPKGNRNHPGEDYQCRCVAVPFLDLGDGDD